MGKNSDIIGSSTDGSLIDLNQLPADAVRALIDRLNTRSQVVTRIFDDEYRLTVDDLKRLLEKVNQEFSGCKKINITPTATIVTSKNRRFDFSSWQEFQDFDRSQPERTRSLTVSLIADILRGDKKDFERFEIEISVQNNPAQFGIQIGPLGIRPIASFDIPPAPIVAKVKFPDYILGKNILATIEDWEQSLTKQDGGIRKRLTRYSHQIRQAIEFLATTSALLGIALLIEANIFNGGLSTASLIFLGATGVYILRASGSQFGTLVERNIDKQRPHANIILTQGDKLEKEKRDKNNRSFALRALSYSMLVTIQIVISVLGGLIVVGLI